MREPGGQRAAADPASSETVVPSDAATRRGRARRARKISVIGVAGELLLTAGVVVLLFVGWQMWIGDQIAAAQNRADALALAEEWQDSPPPIADPSPSASVAPDEPEEPAAPVEPVIAAEPDDGEEFGIMYVPRFGADFAARIGGGVSRARTLDTIGIGHYPGTQMPGEVGNFAVAAHRTGFGGAPFYAIDELRVGDSIIIETQDGWYTYRFRTLEYVRPSAVDVLAPVPQDTLTGAGGRYLTMTSCSPKHTIAERIIAYSVFESFQPRADGPPEGVPGAPVSESAVS
ncbi:MAG: class E sortase [Microbacterium sp.]|uniref:class E sortase n=1 Tax=Microbacterium sp. TaxID=51671 RepID=UPI002720F7A8|nr:class E sortase [Microbacterium sp.]MDO8381922.1 class E sortase [Microbacterium sp.]